MRLEQVAAGVRMQGLDTDGPAEVMAARWIGSDALDVIYRVGTATRSRMLLRDASDTAYAWATGVDAATGRYRGLSFGRAVSVDLHGDGLLVRRDVAQQQMDVPVSPGGEPIPAGPQPGGAPTVVGPEPPAPQLPQRKRRFFGVVTVDSTRPGPQVGQIAQAILAELARAGDAKVTLKLDIEAESVAGFPDDVVSVVTANAQTLKFEQNGFE